MTPLVVPVIVSALIAGVIAWAWATYDIDCKATAALIVSWFTVTLFLIRFAT